VRQDLFQQLQQLRQLQQIQAMLGLILQLVKFIFIMIHIG
jgi:hypothetical protein